MFLWLHVTCILLVSMVTVDSLVEHVINHILHSSLSAYLPAHMTQVLKSVDFILKVNDRSEYLLK